VFSIIDRQELTKRDMISLTVEAPAIARRIRPGQFVILRVNETGERLPLTVAYSDAVNGTITIIFQVVGKSTALLASLPVGDAIRDLAGPLGAVMDFEDLGTVVGVGGGSGIAVLHHLLIGYKEAGNCVVSIIGAREKDLLILEDEMSARTEEIVHAEQEGVQFRYLTSPVRYVGDEQGWVRQLECVPMKLGQPDASGRPRPIPMAGSTYLLDVDLVLVAIGAGPNPTLFAGCQGLERGERGYIRTFNDAGRTSVPCVWAGGDIVTGAATVILAMGAARLAAADIHGYLSEGGTDWPTAGGCTA